MVKPFKFIIQSIMLEYDDEGKIVGEQVAEPMTFYGLEALGQFVQNFDQHLEKAVSGNALARGS